MLVAARRQPTQSSSTTLPTTVYRHQRCADWGLAAIVWEREGKRGYRFEDGRERTFKEGYYQLFEAVDLDDAKARKLLADIERDAVVAQAVASGMKMPKERAATIEELITVFRGSYPDGFADPKWTKRVRGEGSRRRAKRHRGAALGDAARLLDAAVLDQMLAAEDPAGVLRNVVDVMAATDLMTAKQLEALRGAEPRMDLARALRDHLHETDPEGIRFNRVLQLLVRAGVARPSWALLSGLRMLVDPSREICIRSSVFFTMMRTLSPRPARKVSPKGREYNRLVRMARDLRDRLREAGEVPRDMVDVYDFVWETCRPAARARLAELREEAKRAAESESEPVSAPEPAEGSVRGGTAPTVNGATTAGEVSGLGTSTTVVDAAALVRSVASVANVEGATELEAEAA